MAMKNFNDHHVRVKHIPQRTCVACRKVKPKHKLVRLVRVADGSIEIDNSGKQAYRGAYLCALPECWETGLKSDRLEYALKTTLTDSNRERLGEYVSGMLQRVI